MYENPTKGDLDRHLSGIYHEARREARQAGTRIRARWAAGGLGLGSIVTVQTAGAINKIHRNAVEKAMKIICDFAQRMREPTAKLVVWAKPILENMEEALLLEIPAANGGGSGVIHQQAAILRQRLTAALRDVEIGAVGGQFRMTPAETSQARALRLLQTIYEETRDNDRPIIVAERPNIAGLDAGEAKAAWNYLRDKGLIKTFAMPFAAMINAAGVDAIEKAEQLPYQPSSAFPSITYNHIQIENANNSPVQQAGANSVQVQDLRLDGDAVESMRRLVEEMTAYLDELQLKHGDKRDALAQLETLRAQLSHKPNPVIIREAGRTLRNLTEGAIASLAASAIQPSVWQWISAHMPTLFS